MKNLSFALICGLLCLGGLEIPCISAGPRDESPLRCFYIQDFSSSHSSGKKLSASFVDESTSSESSTSCQGVHNYCYTLWLYDKDQKALTVKGQGCWTDEDGKCSSKSCSFPKGKKRSRKHFCCCNEDYCNDNFSNIEYQDPVLPKNTSIPVANNQDALQGNSNAMIFVIPITVAAFFLVIAFIIVCWMNRRYSRIPKPEAEDSPSYTETELDNLKVLESLARGCYGYVYHGRLNEVDVAVKVFSAENRDHFLNERSIYLLPHMEHATLPQYIGSKEQVLGDGLPEYLLVISYSPFGSLQDYLQENTFSWDNLCKMISSISCGLDYLHTKIEKGGKIKPCVVHRDLNSRNVLLKADGNCMLSDFGFAVPTSNFIRNEQELIEQEPNLLDICSLVGTCRYMAPEILQGAINLQGCEDALKQIDVYALGLVMWEAATRCFDMYQGDVPPYKLPYEAEVGKAPNMEQMQRLVAKCGCRPAFPRTWKMSNLAIISLKETIEECWDSEPEGRLTTLCVRERINQLSDLWDKHKDTFYYSVSMDNESYGTNANVEKRFLKTKSYDDSHESGYFTPNSSSEITSQ